MYNHEIGKGGAFWKKFFTRVKDLAFDLFPSVVNTVNNMWHLVKNTDADLLHGINGMPEFESQAEEERWYEILMTQLSPSQQQELLTRAAKESETPLSEVADINNALVPTRPVQAPGTPESKNSFNWKPLAIAAGVLYFFTRK